jgi:iron complex outermembrane receptor protein
VKTIDKENSLQFDGEYRLEKGMFQSLEAGVRYADHRRESARRFPQLRSSNLSVNAPTGPDTWKAYPSDFGAGLDGPAGWDNTSWTLTPDALKAYFAANGKATSADWERRAATELDMRERQSAAYVMANIEADRLSGNVGLRFVRTRVNAQVPFPIPSGSCARSAPGEAAIPCAAYPTALTTVGEGAQYYDNVAFNPLAGVMYYKQPKEASFDNYLPSLNLRYELSKDMIARFGASKTVGRQNYNLLGAGYTGASCTVTNGCLVTAPNPNLGPMVSTNIDASWAWYFARRSMVGVNVFHSKIKGYPLTGSPLGTVELVDPRDNIIKIFNVNSSLQQGARISGIELSYEQPFGTTPFGFTSNVSRAKTKVDDGRPMTGASEYSANLGAYFENDRVSARLVANYRSEYVNSTTAPSPGATNNKSLVDGKLMFAAPTMAAPVTTLAFNASYNISPKLILSFDATNLTNVKRAYYRYSEEEQQKLDVIGRQFYLNLKYKF